MRTHKGKFPQKIYPGQTPTPDATARPDRARPPRSSLLRAIRRCALKMWAGEKTRWANLTRSRLLDIGGLTFTVILVATAYASCLRQLAGVA